MGFWVFDFFFFFLVGFGCDCGLWLKWRFGGCVGGGLVAVVVVAVGCVAGYGCVGGGHMKVVVVGCGCHMKVVAGGVCGCYNCV